MPDQPTTETITTKMIAQVGALLHLNTALPPADAILERGHKHWELDGSCVLISPQHILTIRHIASKLGRYAAFLPGEGIIFLTGDQERDQRFGDNVLLATLQRPVEHLAPLNWEKVKKDTLRHAIVAGYGRWKGLPDEGTDGIQRQVAVRLGMPGPAEGGPRHYDNLDLCWWSPWNREIAALRNNSGGPMLLLKSGVGDTPFTVVGISREEKGSQQVGSWITRDRNAWLQGLFTKLFPDHYPPPKAFLPAAGRVLRAQTLPLLLRPEVGSVVKLQVPGGARMLRATLSATEGLRLQMRIMPAPEPAGFLGDLAQDNESAGRFLYREEGIAGQAEVVVGVTHAASADPKADRVLAQLRCVFV